jgi:UDP-N-acetylglucosamine pyrophosphorylase
MVKHQLHSWVTSETRHEAEEHTRLKEEYKKKREKLCTEARKTLHKLKVTREGAPTEEDRVC